jgi:hypothetical protein
LPYGIIYRYFNSEKRTTMKKRSSYRPKPVVFDVMSMVKRAMTPLTAVKEADNNLRRTTRDAFYRVSSGLGTSHHIGLLAACSNVAMALARDGKGKDWGPEIRLGADSIEAIQVRHKKWGKVQMTPAERDSIWHLIEIHEAQLDATNLKELDKAGNIAHMAIYGEPMQ